MTDRLLTAEQAAERLGTGVRFPRRLIEERRIEFVKIGRHVRIPERVIDAFITASTIRPARRHLRGAA
ncbi:excisionase family DNA-binding protein [Streptomyces niveus]|uniref:excisionase family DNA-binding protein n=1 Tax=Streptomyces niveus TaxID=193462 RepID=UPI003440D3DD